MHLNFVDKNKLIKNAIEQQLKTTIYRERFKIEEEYKQFKQTMKIINETLLNKTESDFLEFPAFYYESKVDEQDFSEKPIIPLKYNKQRGWFMFDETLTSKKILEKDLRVHTLKNYFELKIKNSSELTQDETREITHIEGHIKQLQNLLEYNTKIMNFTNIGLRKEDIWNVYVFKDISMVNRFKAQIPKNGDYKF